MNIRTRNTLKSDIVTALQNKGYGVSYTGSNDLIFFTDKPINNKSILFKKGCKHPYITTIHQRDIPAVMTNDMGV